MLSIDTREKSAEIVSETIARCEELNIPYKMDTLTVGDYLWDDSIVIELKRIDDFEKSMISCHLDSQLIAMKQYPHKLLLIYGDLYSVNRRRTAMTKKQFKNKLLSITTRDGIPYHWVDSPEEVVDAIFKARENIQDKGQRVEQVLRHPTLPGGKEDPSLAFYFALKGVGAEKAQVLKKTYGQFSVFLAHYKDLSTQFTTNKITKKEFFAEFPASLINKTTKTYLDQL